MFKGSFLCFEVVVNLILETKLYCESLRSIMGTCRTFYSKLCVFEDYLGYDPSSALVNDVIFTKIIVSFNTCKYGLDHVIRF